MMSIKGIPVSPGIVVGRVFVLDDEHRRIPRRSVPRDQAPRELRRLEQAIAASIADLGEVRARAELELGKDAANIFSFHIGMLSDPSVTGPMKSLIDAEVVTAEFAASSGFERIAGQFAAMRDSMFTTKVNDINDLSARVLRHLIGEHSTRLNELHHQAVVVARDLTPSQCAEFDREKVVAFATDLGGRTSHTAIVARALGIPAVVGCQNLTPIAEDGAMIIVDGDQGQVILDPDEPTLEEYRERTERRRVFRTSIEQLAAEPGVTLDGVAIEVLGNIEFPEECASAVEHGAEGIGLYRTEFLYLARRSEPSEEDHYSAYARCVELLKGRPLTIRTVDLGADKYTQAQSRTPERNPFLGLRSIRYCLANAPMFRRQIRAILRASALGPIKVMFPLITNLAELRQSNWIVRDVMEDLDEQNLPYDRGIKLGMMVEVPSAAIQADDFAREADFLSIGTNDLTQYTLAVDRTNERVAGMFNPAHPAVIRLVRDVARVARRRNIPVSCCGESAGELEYAALLIGLGLRILSVSPGSIPPLKRMIRGVSVAQCERIARKALSFDSDEHVSAYLRDQLRKIIPEAFDARSVEERD